MSNVNLYTDNLDFLSIDPKKTIFWVGAGVGVLSPCNLPLGNGLTDAILETSIGKANMKALVDLWNDKFPAIRNSIQNNDWRHAGIRKKYGKKEAASTNERPRLEFIIGEIHKMDLEFQDISFQKDTNRETYRRESIIAPLKNFSEAKPNIYHYALADFMRAGSAVITTNFDVCIEKAFGLKESEMIIKDIHGVKAIEYAPNSFVYHVHGIATDKNIDQNLGATLTNVSKSVSVQFADTLCKCFSDNYTLIFIGYGGVDFFDIKPFFDSLKEKAFPGKVIYLHYCKEEDCENEIKKKKAYQYLLTPFREQYICYGDTTLFQKNLAMQSGIVSTSRLLPDKHGTAFLKTKETLSENIAAYTHTGREKYQFINIFRIASQLNISMEYFYSDWAERLAEIYNDWKNDASEQATLKDMIQKPTDIARCIVDDIRNNNWYSKNKVYSKICREITPMFKIRKSSTSSTSPISPITEHNLQEYVSQTCKILEMETDDENSFRIETATIQYLCGPYTKKLYLRWIYDVFNRREIEKKLFVLLDYLNQLLVYPYNHFRYMTFYIALNRRRHILNAILEKDPIVEADGSGSSHWGDIYSSRTKCYGDIQGEWDICMEVPNLYDAGKVIQGALEQYIILCLKGKGLHLWKMYHLFCIRRQILKLRKDKNFSIF